MSKSILVIGESGSGKTTAMRNLPPAETFYIDADGKGLSWKGWRKQYNAEAKNYLRSSDADTITGMLMKINDSAKHVKYIIIDTINAIMLDREMTDETRSYQKWSDIATDGYKLCLMANAMRDDLTVIVIGHSETIVEEDGSKKTRLKTNGRKLEKIVLESKFTTVIMSKLIDDEYSFITRAPESTCKTPLGAFEDAIIPNDIINVIKALEDY